MATAWRYIREAVDLLAAATAPTLAVAMHRIRRLAYVILQRWHVANRAQGFPIAMIDQITHTHAGTAIF